MAAALAFHCQRQDQENCLTLLKLYFAAPVVDHLKGIPT
jgi:hypothetical protein